MEDLKELAIDPSKLVEARKDLPLTKVAKAIGVSKQRLWNYENGYSAAPSNVILRLCCLYKVPIEELSTTAKINRTPQVDIYIA